MALEGIVRRFQTHGAKYGHKSSHGNYFCKCGHVVKASDRLFHGSVVGHNPKPIHSAGSGFCCSSLQFPMKKKTRAMWESVVLGVKVCFQSIGH